MEPHRIALRALFAYFVLLALVRASGKRAVAQATAFDFVLALVIGDMVDDVLWAEVRPAVFAAGAGALFLAERLASYLSARSPRVSRLINGAPTLVIAGGSLETRALRRERLSEADVGAMLRLDEIDERGLGDVAEAQLEASGRLSVRRQEHAEGLQKRDLRGRKGPAAAQR